MNILLDGYLDRNFGDDLILRLTARYFRQHSFYLNVKQDALFIPFQKDPNILDMRKTRPKQFDLALTVIGSGFMDITWAWLHHFLREEWERRRMTGKLPTAVIGCNIGPLEGRMAKFFVHSKLYTYDLVTVRDTASMTYMDQFLRGKEKACYPDIAFSLPEEWIPLVASEECLGISAYGALKNNRINFFNNMACIADWYVEKTGRQVLLFAFDLGQENDLEAAYAIKRLCRHQEMIEIIPHKDNGMYILYHLRRCGRILAVRFHMMVMAVRMGIPFVPAAYSDKTRNVLKDMQYDGEVFDAENLEAERLKYALSQCRTFYPEEGFFEEAKGHFHAVEKLLEGRRGS